MAMTSTAPRCHSLQDWLAWAEALHAREIDLGLDRAARVLQALALPPRHYRVITVAGTNGKGSTVAMLESCLLAAGLRVGCYSSPHLLRYNERVRVNGQPVSDAELCAGFAAVDAVRDATSITYFEFGTLAAFHIFAHQPLDVVVLEVGMGGRLDAVNLVDADVAVVTSIGIDHVEFLGPDRESIGREKAGIFRAGRPAVCSDPAPPASVLNEAARLGVPLACFERDYRYSLTADGQHWNWQGRTTGLTGLPRPALRGDVQLQNAAGVLAALESLAAPELLAPEVIARGLREVVLAGRFQVVPGQPRVVLDVAHNPHAALRLAETLRAEPRQGPVLAVVGMLRDKDAAGVFASMAPLIDAWFLVGLDSPRAATPEQLAEALHQAEPTAVVVCCANVADAMHRARQASSDPKATLLVFGSFLTVADALRWLETPVPDCVSLTEAGGVL